MGKWWRYQSEQRIGAWKQRRQYTRYHEFAAAASPGSFLPGYRMEVVAPAHPVVEAAFDKYNTAKIGLARMRSVGAMSESEYAAAQQSWNSWLRSQFAPPPTVEVLSGTPAAQCAHASPLQQRPLDSVQAVVEESTSAVLRYVVQLVFAVSRQCK